MPKDKEGNKLTWKEFFKRWKEGINGITPLQQLKTQKSATKIQLIGIILGLVMCFIGYKNLWWVAIILFGALINTGVQYLQIKQQIKAIEDLENNSEEMSLDEIFMEDEMKGGKEDGHK